MICCGGAGTFSFGILGGQISLDISATSRGRFVLVGRGFVDVLLARICREAEKGGGSKN